MAFSPRVKIALLAAAILAFFLVVLLVILPTVIINKPETRAALQQRLGALLGGKVACDQVKLSLFPRVCATIGHPRLDLPGKVSARAAEFDLCLKLLPLLRGRVVADAIKAKSPEISLPIAADGLADGGPGISDPRLLLPWMADRLKHIPESDVEITDGRLAFAGADGTRFEFRNLNVQFTHSGSQLEWSLRGESDFLKTFSSRGRLHTGSFRGTGTLQASDFRPQPVYAFLWPNAPFQLLDTHADLDLALSLEGSERLKVQVKGKAPLLTLGQSQRTTRLVVDRFAADVELSEKKLAVFVPDFSSSLPRAELQLGFVFDEDVHPRIKITLAGRGDSAGARDFTLAMLHEFPEALLVCDIVRAGEVPDISVSLHGDAWNDLADPNNLLIRGRLENGRIYIPWIDLDLGEVDGDALIAGGILEGRNLKARHAGARGQDGTLRVGLTAANPVLQLDIFTRAELSGLPRFLAKIVPDAAFRREMGLVREFSGTASGTLRLDGTHTNIGISVQAADIDVKARHQLIAYPLRFQGGEFAYDGDSISLRGVDVAVGNSRLFKHDLTVGLNEKAPLKSSSPRAVIDLTEIFNLFRDQPPFNHLRRLDGVLTLDNWQLDGQAFDPGTWNLTSNGTLQDLAVESEYMPGPLRLASGRMDWLGRGIRYESGQGSINHSEIKGLAVAADWTGPARVQLRALELDASLDDISRTLQSFPKTATYAAAFSPVNGTVRIRAIRFQTRLLPEGPILDQFDAELQDAVITSAALELPLVLSSGGVAWQGSRLDFRIAKASLGKSEIQNLSVSGDMRFDGGLELRADAARVECSEVIPHIFSLAGQPFLREDVRDMRGSISLSDINLKGPAQEPGRWRLQAAAELENIVINTTFLDEPIGIPGGRLTAAVVETSAGSATELHVDSTQLSIGADSAVVNGDLSFYPLETLLDLSISAQALDWNKIETISERIARRRQGESRPVRGRLGMRVERLAFERLSLYPFHADAILSPEGTTLAIERASLCGMVFIGRLAFDGPVVDAYLVPVVDVMALDSVIACLTSEESRITGNFNLDGALQVKARREDIARALKGRLLFVTEDGTILQSLFFARLFALLNLTEIYRGQLPDITSQGLDYKRSAATLEVKDGKILVHDWSIDGRTLWMGSRGEIDIATQKIDFTIMVSPFKTIDRIINAIPGIRWILGGRLVAIPMKATGTLEDPQIVPLSPSAVGTSILEMIERTLLLPIEIIQPLVPGLEQQDSGTITR